MLIRIVLTVIPRIVPLLAVGLLVPLSLVFSAESAPPAPRGWQPQPYTVSRDEAAGVLRLATPYYTIEHDLKHGGAISRISLTHGRAANLLVQPLATGARVLPPEAGPQTTAEESRSFNYNDTHGPAAAVTHSVDGNTATVTVEAPLLNDKGHDSGIHLRTVYRYRWGYIKVHKEFIVPEDRPVEVASLCALSTTLDPSLTDYGYRPGLDAMMACDLFYWNNDEIKMWGKIRPGTHFDLPLICRHLPRYLVFANPGIEGLEWFMADDLAQWNYQITGRPGNGFCRAGAGLDPLGVTLSICPVMLSSSVILDQGGRVSLAGSYSYDFYLGLPILEGHAQKPFLNQHFAPFGGKWFSEKEIKGKAEAGGGLLTMRLHNDGDHLKDGLFWRDGSYPPYPPEQMKKMDQAIENMHRYGIPAVPYFSDHELHPSTPEFAAHAKEWGRLVDDCGNLYPNRYFGSQMCLKSGWLDYLKFSIDRVLKNHSFDGVYYDWNLAMFCNNPLHVGAEDTGLPKDGCLGTAAVSPTAHWDIDELLDLMEWSRERVGPEGLVMLHNTLVPMFATENFANYVVGLEFSYAMVNRSIPRPEELPLEWNFASARSRGAIRYGLIPKGAPKSLERQFALTGLMTSVAPWPASDLDLEMFAILRPLGDIEQYRFEDWRNEAVQLNDPGCGSALYSQPGEAFILLANYSGEAKEVRCSLRPGKLPHPLTAIDAAELIDGERRIQVDAAALAGAGAAVTVAPRSAVLLHVR